MCTRPSVVRYACYMSNVSMAAVANLSPLLFITFHQLYGISYTLLGLLVLINFCTQLCVDLVFSFFSHRFPIQKTVRVMPVLTIVGLLVYSILPALFAEKAYWFLVLGTVIFSASAGLAEVLISPVIAALPSDNPERDMSRAHSVYAWGVAVSGSCQYAVSSDIRQGSVVFSCDALGGAAAFRVYPFFVLGASCPRDGKSLKRRQLRFGILCCCSVCSVSFSGGASENTMSQWCSGYLEAALKLPKLRGDVFGVAVFAVMLGLGRTLYAKFGKNISRFLLLGFAGAFLCYVTAALSQNAVVGLAACALTGLCVSMLWPGTLIYTAQSIPKASVAVYALLAAGGDLGGSIAPQLVGGITDAVSQSAFFASLSESLCCGTRSD